MIRFRSIATLLVLAALAVCAHSQGSTGGLLYASDFAKWTLPQGNTPAKGAIVWPNQETCKISPAGYNSPALKVGRRVTIVDANPSLTETVTPSAISSGNSGCMMAATMVNSHSSYQITSGTAGLQEALDYQASFSQGAVIVLTPAWTAAGGTTGMITSAAGYAGASILDERTSKPTAYTWNGSVYVANPFALMTTGSVAGNCAQIGPGNTITSTGGPCSASAGSVIASPRFSMFYQPTLGSSATAQGDPNITTDGSGRLTSGASISTFSPIADIRASGAVIDGATPIDTALNAAINKCQAANGNTCKVLLPCAGPTVGACYLSNGAGLAAAPSNRRVELDIQGYLQLGSTLVVPNQFKIKGDGGSVPGQFQSKASGGILAPAVAGTMGTAVTVTASPTTFTPTFSLGDISHFHVNGGITVAGLQTCTASALRYTPLAGQAHAPTVTFTASSCTSSSGVSEGIRIPVASTVTVTGCSNSTFNVNATPVNGQDWPNSQITAYIPGGSPGDTATGCTLVGFDDDNYESVRIEAVSGGVLTAKFAHKHAASDVWGMVGVATGNTSLAIGSNLSLEGISISSGYGVQLLLDNTSTISMDGVFAQPQAIISGGAVECAGCWWGQWNSVQFSSNFAFQCTSNCGQSSYPYALRCTQDAYASNGVGCGTTQISNATIIGGIKVDQNGLPSNQGAGIDLGLLQNLSIEQGAGAGIMVDPRNNTNMGGQVTVSTDRYLMTDNFIGNVQAFIGGTDCCVTNGYADLGNLQSYIGNVQLSNQYWSDKLAAKNVARTVAPTVNPASQTHHTATGVLSDGITIEANIRGSGSNLSPALIPAATMAVSTPTCTTCTAGVLGPDGSLSAWQFDHGGPSDFLQAGLVSIATYPGDAIIFGSWVAPGSSTIAGSIFGSDVTESLHTFSTDTFENGSADINCGGFLVMFGDSWQPGACVAMFATGDSTPHNIRLALDAGSKFWSWFWMFVPGPNNPAYAGVTRPEVMRWKQQLLHGYVPSAAPAGGSILAMAPGHKLYWGSDTDLYRSAAGVLKTDGTVNAVSGYQVNGTALATGNLSDWTNTGVANNKVPLWNSGTSKWTPGTVPVTPAATAQLTTRVDPGTYTIQQTDAMIFSHVGTNVLTFPAGNTFTVGTVIALYNFGGTMTVSNVFNLTNVPVSSGALIVNWGVGSNSWFAILKSPTKVNVSITPAAATASSCVEQTFNTFTGLATNQQVSVSPPSTMGTHLWIGSTRVSAADTLAISFCADATGGTPPAGNWIATATQYF